MKIFITKNYPNAHFYYKVLRFLLEHATRKEIDFYLDEIEKDNKGGRQNEKKVKRI